jgi:hypothetical protein
MELQPQAESAIDRRCMQDATRVSVTRFVGPVLTMIARPCAKRKTSALGVPSCGFFRLVGTDARQ